MIGHTTRHLVKIKKKGKTRRMAIRVIHVTDKALDPGTYYSKATEFIRRQAAANQEEVISIGHEKCTRMHEEEAEIYPNGAVFYLCEIVKRSSD